MVDEVPPEEQPIIVDPSARTDMFVTGLRQIVLVIGGAGTVIGFAKTHDIHAAMGYVLSSDFAVASSATVTIIAFVYGQLRVLWNKRKLVTAARSADDSVAVVRKKAPLAERFTAQIKRIF